MTDATVDAPLDAVIARVKKTYGSWGRGTTVQQMREDWDALFGVKDLDAAVQAVDAGGVACEWVTAPGADTSKTVIYFHGGGFQVGSLVSHRELMACISAETGCRVLGVGYRLAPEHRYPAALDDARASYEWLLNQGVDARDIALAGDSAGGGLALALLVFLRDAGQPLPVAAALLSAWTDLTASGASYETRAASDPIHQRPMIQAMARNYLGKDGDAKHPYASPQFASLANLPPLLAQVGDRETVLSDTTDFIDKARTAGVDARAEVWPGMIHVFQQFPRELPQAREALQSIGAFLRQHLNTKPLQKEG
ncbi:MAG: alpha/beta hydrolase [Comamonadaceae bacterium]|nr:MAG: alpha/beta hydrolase [Comamonadaceae bacterium]